MSNLNSVDFGSDSEEEGDFNPGPAVGSDDEGGSERENSAPKSNSKPSSRKTGPVDDDEDEDGDGGDKEARNGGYDDDDEDDDDDEEEDDDDEVVDRPRKRARRDRRNQYIDIEAEVDDEDDEDDGDEDEAQDFIAKDADEEIADLPPGAEMDDRRHRELDRKREREQQLDAEKQAEILKERYGRSRREVSDVALVPKRLLLPGVNDPNIWGVRCKQGKEKEVVYSILKRVEERMFSNNPMPITSAFERGLTAMTGYIYVEARKQGDVLAALEGLMNVYPRTKMVLVPIKEMSDLLRVNKSVELQPGGYVRIKRGKYAGDLAQIEDVESNGLEVTLRIVPRLSYGLDEDVNGPAGEGTPDSKRKRGGAVGAAGNLAQRPPQRLFSETEAKKRHSRWLQSQSTFDKRHWIYFGDQYINGYLIKDFKIQHLETQDANPSLAEVTKFAAGAEDGTENLDLSALQNSLKMASSHDNYLPGDIVEVYEGEQQGVTGRAMAVRGDIVSLTVTEGELRGQNIEVPTKGLRKRFREGDHVKVIGGSRYKDEVGMVVRIKEDRVTIVSDLSMQEIHVFSKDLRKAADTGMAGGLGRYDIHDLVQLEPTIVGCVIKVDRESLRVLDQNGAVKTVMPSQISNKIERRRHAVATDKNGSEIRQDDTVREIGGENKQGVIIHIHRSFLFLHNREQTENSGIFVVRATNVATVAAKGGRIAQQQNTGPDLARMNPALLNSKNANGGAAMPPPKSFGRDRTLGQTVTVRKGPYKGLLGIVKDTTDTEARVELHTKSKTIQIAKDILSFKDPVSGNSMDFSTFSSRGRGRGGPGQSMNSGGATPSRIPGGWGGDSGGGRTPSAANGGRTPAWGSAPPRTPAWSGGGGSGFGGGRTPRWGGGDGGKTPAWGADGGRTSYGGAGGRTPAWGDSGSRTSYGGSDFAGSRTPAYDSSSRTPAYNYNGSTAGTGASSAGGGGDPWARSHDAPTPAAPSAPTPSNPYSAPTPAAAASTPGYSGYGLDAPTPAGAPTPFAGSAETPAWAGDDGDEGPRYEDGPDTP